MSDILANERLTVVDHPLVAHKLQLLRNKDTSTKEFRELVSELGTILVYEASRDFPLEDIQVETPITTTSGRRIVGDDFVVVPIIRAGLGMVDGILDLVPSARVGHVGMYRDEETFEPVEYYKHLPPNVDKRICFVVDPMLATGGSLTATIHFLREEGVKDIRALTIISAPEGIKAALEYDPDVRIWTCVVDEGLNENAYIVPGLGDAGDRIFGTQD